MIEPKKVFQFRKAPNASSEQHFMLTLANDLPYFDGHFPGNPVLPGIAILDASAELIRFVEGREFYLQKIKSSKFMDLIRPGDTLHLNLESKISADDSLKEFKVTWTRTELPAADLVEASAPVKKVSEVDLIVRF